MDKCKKEVFKLAIPALTMVVAGVLTHLFGCGKKEDNKDNILSKNTKTGGKNDK